MYDLVISLGWGHSGSWANREFYSLGKFTLVEHNGCWNIAKGDNLYFIDSVDADILKEYTAIVTTINSNLENPDCTLREFRENLARLNAFYEKYGGETEDFEDLYL